MPLPYLLQYVEELYGGIDRPTFKTICGPLTLDWGQIPSTVDRLRHCAYTDYIRRVYQLLSDPAVRVNELPLPKEDLNEQDTAAAFLVMFIQVLVCEFSEDSLATYPTVDLLIASIKTRQKRASLWTSYLGSRDDTVVDLFLHDIESLKESPFFKHRGLQNLLSFTDGNVLGYCQEAQIEITLVMTLILMYEESLLILQNLKFVTEKDETLFNIDLHRFHGFDPSIEAERKFRYAVLSGNTDEEILTVLTHIAETISLKYQELLDVIDQYAEGTDPSDCTVISRELVPYQPLDVVVGTKRPRQDEEPVSSKKAHMDDMVCVNPQGLSLPTGPVHHVIDTVGTPNAKTPTTVKSVLSKIIFNRITYGILTCGALYAAWRVYNMEDPTTLLYDAVSYTVNLRHLSHTQNPFNPLTGKDNSEIVAGALRLLEKYMKPRMSIDLNTIVNHSKGATEPNLPLLTSAIVRMVSDIIVKPPPELLEQTRI